MVLKKKGIFFTLLSIMIITILFMLFTSKEYITNIDRMPVIKERITKVDNFVRNLEESYIERTLKYSTYNALRAITLYIENQSRFFNTTRDFNCAFETVVMTGTLSNTSWSTLITDTYFNITPELANNTGSFLGNRVEWFGANHILAQMFIPHTSGNLESAEFKMNWQYPPPKDFKNVSLELRTDICDTPSDIILDTTIIESPPNAGWVDRIATFPNKPYIQSGKKYYFIFSSEDTPLDRTGIRATDDAYTNGTLYSSDSPSITVKIDDVTGQKIMEGNTLLERLEGIENASRRIFFTETDFNIVNITLYQDNDTAHWYVGVGLNVSYVINSTIAYWKNNILVTSLLSIVGMEDPYYYVMSNRTTRIIENEFENITTEDITKNFLWNLTYLQKHINYTTYKPEEKAPNFLMRFTNNTNSSICCGIESIISNQSEKNMSYIDYCFWSGTCDGSDPDGNFSLYAIDGITTEEYPFKLEPYHWKQYNVSEYARWVNVTP